jgi:N-acyl-D-aspartate/D-glutamate deacylase
MDFGPGNLGLRLVPGCEWLFHLSPAELVASLRTDATRARVRDAFMKVNDGFALTIVKSIESWVINDIAPPLQRLLGRTVGEVAAERGKSPLDSMLDLAVESDLDVGFIRMRYLEDDATWEVREKLLKDPRVVLGASDAGAHVDSIANAEYPTAALKELVRQRPVFRVEELIRLMTSVPAQLYGLSQRGTILPGAVADLVLFDPLTIGPDDLHFAHDFPGGVSHLTSAAIGVDRVFVRGVEVVRDGVLTGAQPGQILRSGRDTVSTSSG